MFRGVTAAVVGLPVALAFGVVSGLGALAGMYGAIAVGFFAAVFGGTRSLTSAPTGPMAVAMAVIVSNYADSLAEAFTIAVMAGLIQILLGVVGIGRFVAYTPYSVISGFMSGIGVIIILVQTLPFLGAPVASGGPLGALRELPAAIARIDWAAFAISAVTLVVAVARPSRARRIAPSALAALIVGTLLGGLWLTGTPVIGDAPTGLPGVRAPVLSLGFLAGAIQPALTLALLGAIDSLLTSLIADSMTTNRHKPNRELVGQGIGNVVAGIIGGLPGAGTTLSTVVNLRAGGRGPVAGALNALILLALVLGLGRYVENIPLAVLSGILIKVGWDVIDRRFLARALRLDRHRLLVMSVTLGVTVFLDLVTAVVLGLIAAAMLASERFEQLELDSVIYVPLLDQSFLGDEEGAAADEFSAMVGLVALRGTFTAASARSLINVISLDIRDHEVVILDFSGTVYLDESAALVVERLIDVAIAANTDCVVMGLGGGPASVVDALDVLGHVPDDRVVGTLDEAREVARRLIENRHGAHDSL